jgi:hypothetical protein
MVFLTINFLRRQTVGKKIQDLSAYDFSTRSRYNVNDRFILTYSNKTLATTDFQTLNQVVISNKIGNKNQYLCRDHRQSFFYDFWVVRFIKKTNIATNELVISNLIQSNQALIVKVVLQNAGTVSQKHLLAYLNFVIYFLEGDGY